MGAINREYNTMPTKTEIKKLSWQDAWNRCREVALKNGTDRCQCMGTGMQSGLCLYARNGVSGIYEGIDAWGNCPRMISTEVGAA